jgi:GNAT superfamily N-acetyltransferase
MTTKYATRYTTTLGAPALTNRRGIQFNLAPAAQPTANVLFYSWWHTDPTVMLAQLPGFGVEIADDFQLLAGMARLDLAEVHARVRGGHRPYVARVGKAPVAYGWSALSRASIGELGLEFAIPAGNRYLWDFATLPAWRGRGIYPRLLDAIVRHESSEAARFWIGHVDGNHASQRGIIKAGFGAAGTTERQEGRALRFAATGPAVRAQACAQLLRL